MNEMKEYFIVFVAFGIMIIAMASVLVWAIQPLVEYETKQSKIYQKCVEMNFGDNSTTGINLTLQKECWEFRK